MVAQFRQVGIPDARTTSAEVRRQLRRAQQRAEAVLNRPKFPRPAALLATITSLQQAVQTAYSLLPLHRLSSLKTKLSRLYDEIDRGAYFGFRPEALGADKDFRQIYSELTGILVDISSPFQSKQEPEPDPEFDSFLQKASRRGWKVPDKRHAVDSVNDGFAQSSSYLQKISIPTESLLSAEVDYGTLTGSIILLTDRQIPESTLRNWTSLSAVYIVFGCYVVLPHIKLMGVSPRIALQEADGKATLKLSNIISIANKLPEEDAASLIRYPRRVQQHYYCPLFSVAGQDKRYFKTWDLLVQG